MEFPIDGVLSLISTIYQNYETFNTRCDDVNDLIRRVLLFEIPVIELKNHTTSESIGIHIQELYKLISEIKTWTEQFNKKGRVSSFFTAILDKQKITSFHTRIDTIRTHLNFEMDVLNHKIFHNLSHFNSSIKLVMENMSQNQSNHAFIDEIITNRIEFFIKEYTENEEHKTRLLEHKCNELEQKLEQLQHMYQCLLSQYHELLHQKSENQNKYKYTSKIEKKTDEITQLIRNMQNNSNPVIKKHFRLKIQVILMEDTVGYLFFDGEQIIKLKSLSDVVESWFSISESSKKKVVYCKQQNLRKLLYQYGFSYLLIDKSNACHDITFKQLY